MISNAIKREEQSVKRFEIWTADLPFLKGSTLKCGRRPVVIVSDDQSIEDNSSVSVVPLTKNLEGRQLPTHVLLCSRYLNHPSRALCEQVTTLDMTRLVHRIGYVEDPFDRFAINRALAAQFHLAPAQMIYVQEDDNYGYYWNV